MREVITVAGRGVPSWSRLELQARRGWSGDLGWSSRQVPRAGREEINIVGGSDGRT